MSIAHELSSDVAAAMLAKQGEESTRSAHELAGVVSEVHSTLRRLTAEGRRRKAWRQDPGDASHTAGAGSSSSGR